MDRVLIIGGGLMGVTTLHALATRGRDAILLEAESGLAEGTSFANGGVLHPSLPDAWNTPDIGKVLLKSLLGYDTAFHLRATQIPNLLFWGLRFLRNATPARHRAIARANFLLARYATERAQTWLETLGLYCGSQGMLKILPDAKSLAHARTLADALADLGLVYDVLDTDALVAREPALGRVKHRLAGALYFPNDRVSDARAFCLRLAQDYKTGGQIVTETRATRLIVERGRVVGVACGDEIYRGEVVLCAGVGAPKLAAQVGVRLPVRPAKGYSLTVPKPPDADCAPQHPMVDPTRHIALTPFETRLRVLGMAEFAGFDTRIDPRRVAVLQNHFTNMFPDAAAQIDWTKGEAWAGLRPMAADGRPFIGASGVSGLWLNCGHGHLGWTMSVGSAELLADMMLGREPEIDGAPFAPTNRAY